MQRWHHLELDRLREWIRDCASGAVPPIYPLTYPEKADTAWRAVPGAGAEMRRRLDSGVYEVRFTDRWANHSSRIRDSVQQIAAEQDKRQFIWSDSSSGVIVGQIESSIPEAKLPVIGPGGRVTIANEARFTSADIVVRQRHSGLASRWRTTDELAASLERRIAERTASHTIEDVIAEFGYWELSKYERQDWLRPVLFLSFRVVFRDDDQLQWGDTIIEPITTQENIGLLDGLGSWVE